MSISCPDCLENLDHCHGTVVTNVDGIAECTDDDCRDLRRERHVLTDIP